MIIYTKLFELATSQEQTYNLLIDINYKIYDFGELNLRRWNCQSWINN